MEKMKKILMGIGSFVLTVLLTIVAVFIVMAKQNMTKKDEITEAEKAREDKKNELEEKSADDIAADSPNPDTVSTNIQREQEALRQRLRDRFNKNIQRNRSSSDN